MQAMNSISKGGQAIVAASLVAMLGGCAASNAMKPSAFPGIRLDMPRSGYQILNTVEGKGSVTRILCIFSLGDSQFGYSSLGGGPAIGLAALTRAKDAVAAATYDAISKSPKADMFLPLTTVASSSGLGCLFSTERATVRGKAVRIKSDR